jgi:cysteinyl-tRNA synthetase
VVTQLALAHPEVQFRAVSNGRAALTAPRAADLRDRLGAVWGYDVAQRLLGVQRDEYGVTVHGWVSPPDLTRGGRDEVVVTVNGRPVRDPALFQAVLVAYRPLLPRDRFPFVGLSIALPAADVDANVHPTKAWVRFRHPRLVQEMVVAAIGPITRAPGPNVAVPMGKPPEVKSWRYQLQDINPYVVANSPADLVVIDYAGPDGPFTRAQVEQMQRKPDGSRRIMLSYMSIGEAEDYRWYWPQRSPTWLGPENKKWRGNYGVRFWHPDWQQIIFEYTDKIVASGFDGVYLDKVDEFETMGHRDDMVEFVNRIATRAKSQRADFLVISQNGDQLISDPKFRRAIDGFAREDLFYGEDSEGARNGAASIRESVKRLKTLTAEGKPVFVVEYPRNEEQAKTARREIAEQGFIGLTTRRSLNAL